MLLTAKPHTKNSCLQRAVAVGRLALQTDRRVFIVRKFVDVDGLYGAFIYMREWAKTKTLLRPQPIDNEPHLDQQT